MSEYRRSLLQTRILIKLNEKSVKTITDLSELVGAQRPSVSRSIRKLKEQGLVLRNHRGWHLTDAGQAEALIAEEKLREARQEIKESAKQAREVMMKALQQSTYPMKEKFYGDIFLKNKAISEFVTTNQQIASEALADIAKQVKATAKLLPAVEALSGFKGAIDKVIDMKQFSSPWLSEEFSQKAITALLDIQEQNRFLLSKAMSSQASMAFEKIANQNNLLMTKALDNVLSFRQGEMNRLLAGVGSMKLGWIAEDLNRVNQAYLQQFREQVRGFEAASRQALSSRAIDRFVVPTTTVSYYTDSVRDFIEAEIEDELSPFSEQVFEEYGDKNLDSLLNQINPEFVGMRRGSWSALWLSGPDRLRHAATSQRELIRQLLEYLIPDLELPKDLRGAPQLKARIRKALGTSKSDAEFIESICHAVVSCYSQLNKYTHHNVKHAESLMAILHTGEGWIRFILAQLELDRD